MPPSFLIASLAYPGRQRWSWVVARSFSGEDMAAQVGPDGNSSSCVSHLPFLDSETRPTPPVPTFHSQPPLVLPSTPSTS